jgi:hypothetical protein
MATLPYSTGRGGSGTYVHPRILFILHSERSMNTPSSPTTISRCFRNDVSSDQPGSAVVRHDDRIKRRRHPILGRLSPATGETAGYTIFQRLASLPGLTTAAVPRSMRQSGNEGARFIAVSLLRKVGKREHWELRLYPIVFLRTGSAGRSHSHGTGKWEGRAIAADPTAGLFPLLAVAPTSTSGVGRERRRTVPGVRLTSSHFPHS